MGKIIMVSLQDVELCGHAMGIGSLCTLCACMFNVPKEVSGFSGQLRYVDTCPNQPEPGKAFCSMHCSLAEKDGIPTGLRTYKSWSHPSGMRY